jgi:hypothetical protein
MRAITKPARVIEIRTDQFAGGIEQRQHVRLFADQILGAFLARDVARDFRRADHAAAAVLDGRHRE